MARSALALFGTATAVACLDLAHKAGAGAQYIHERSGGYVALVLGLATIWAVAILATRSLSLALGGGVLAGGALGNLVSLALWPGVPNPILVGPIAFNLADVFVLFGFAFVAAATLALVARSPERLREPVGVRSQAAEHARI